MVNTSTDRVFCSWHSSEFWALYTSAGNQVDAIMRNPHDQDHWENRGTLSCEEIGCIVVNVNRMYLMLLRRMFTPWSRHFVMIQNILCVRYPRVVGLPGQEWGLLNRFPPSLCCLMTSGLSTHVWPVKHIFIIDRYLHTSAATIPV